MNSAAPDGWELKTIGDIGSVVTGSTPNTQEPRYWGGSIPFISPADFDGKVYIDKTGRTLSAEGAEKSRVLPENSILVTCIGSLGGMAMSSRPSVTNQQINAVVADSNQESRFHFYNILFNINELTKNAGTTTLPIINKSTFSQIDLLFPPLPEQQKIATILSSVDDVIEKTRAQIDKLKDLKTGMMQELLTKGIGSGGAPHTEFKDSPVGRIPSSWEVASLGDTGSWKGGGTPSKSNKDYWNGAIPWVSPKDMKSEFIYQTEDQISEEAVSESSTNIVESGAILIVVRSGILKHTLPVAMAARDLTLNQDMKALTVTKRFSAHYVYQYLLANNHRVLRATLKAGNTVESLDFSEFSKFLIPCPPTEEQHKIANAIESIARRIRTKSLQLNTYISMKKALMQDLLTGKVRVNITENEKEPAVA